MHKTITFRVLEKLSNNNRHIESLSIEIIRKNQKNIILSCIYRPSRGDPQGTIQKKSAFGCWMLPCLVIFLRNFILIRKCEKLFLNRGNLVSATVICQTKCLFTVLSVLFLFFCMLPYDSRLFPDPNIFTSKIKKLAERNKQK